ncbi:NAD-dependent histone deacetylase sir2 [Gonapodya sp. JEL0774]|nr:NAD-dependent histone deacetylase sir2 [Gonapodya sp. JEL0774]
MTIPTFKRPPELDSSDKIDEEQASQKRIRIDEGENSGDSTPEGIRTDSGDGGDNPSNGDGIAKGAESSRSGEIRTSLRESRDVDLVLEEGKHGGQFGKSEVERRQEVELQLEDDSGCETGSGQDLLQDQHSDESVSSGSELQSDYEVSESDDSSSGSSADHAADGEEGERRKKATRRSNRFQGTVPMLDEMVSMMRDMERLDMNRWLERYGDLPVLQVLRTIAVLAPSLLPANLLPLLLPGTGRSTPDSTSSVSTSGQRPYLGRRALSDSTMVKVLGSVLKEVCPRSKVEWVKSVEDILDLIRSSSEVVVLAGAGTSVNCGIPDFRSEDGIYARLKGRFGLKRPEDMFSLPLFLRRPDIFYSFAEEIYCAPGAAENRFQPGAAHWFFRLLSEKGRLKRIYTQNIDSLDILAGVPKEKVVQCHGSFASASCVVCDWKCEGNEIEAAVKEKRVPRCPVCPPKQTRVPPPNEPAPPAWDDSTLVEALLPPPIKPDIVFFGEQLPSTFHRLIQDDLPNCKVMLVVGTSLQVAPVATMPKLLPVDVPAVVVNKTPVRPGEFDVELLGDVDAVVGWICKKLEWEGRYEELRKRPVETREGEVEAAEGKVDKEALGCGSGSQNENAEDDSPYRFVEPNRYLFPGAVLESVGGKRRPSESWEGSDETTEDESDVNEALVDEDHEDS